MSVHVPSQIITALATDRARRGIRATASWTEGSALRAASTAAEMLQTPADPPGAAGSGLDAADELAAAGVVGRARRAATAVTTGSAAVAGGAAAIGGGDAVDGGGGGRGSGSVGAARRGAV
jgi:hypothetical protein